MFKKILLSPAADEGAGAPSVDPALAQENKALRERLKSTEERVKSLEAKQGKVDASVRKRMALGLTREQAEAAERNQERYDSKRKQ